MKVIIFSAPSGSGKTSIVKELLKSFDTLEFSISATSREKRNNEQNGVDYYFQTAEEFRNNIDNDNFIEWEEVYTDCYYGTLKNEVERIWKKGNCVIFDVDVMGGVNIKKIYGGNALGIFIRTPSFEELETRLRNRNTETEDTLQKRLDRARMELEYADSFDVTIVNDSLPKAIEEATSVVKEFIK